jgi:hypothetical protein
MIGLSINRTYIINSLLLIEIIVPDIDKSNILFENIILVYFCLENLYGRDI